MCLLFNFGGKRMTALAHTNNSYMPALVIFGKDDSGKAHASSFGDGDVALATKAASLMGMRLLPVQTEEERALAAKVPKGKVFASGRGFVPFVKASLFAAIEAIAPASEVAASSKSQAPAELIHANEETDAEELRVAAALLTEVTPAVPQPTGWHDIQVGSIVLSAAQPGQMDWFECLVLSVEAEHRYELRYCDWPQEPTFTHHVADIGLLHPSRQPEPPIDAEPATTA